MVRSPLAIRTNEESIPLAESPSRAPRPWHSGDQILLRHRRLGPVSYAWPVTVVSDASERTLLYLRPGTPIKRRVMPDGMPFDRQLPYREAYLVPLRVGDGTWTTHHVLIEVRPGDAFDIRHFWAEDWSFRGWYVNLQQPVARVRTGFDTADHVLDIWVDPDGTWRWKDEHEMAEAVRIGRFGTEEAATIRQAGESVIPRIETRQPPFDGSLVSWRPDPAWSLPSLPGNWNAGSLEVG
jgi:hypothetical protein